MNVCKFLTTVTLVTVISLFLVHQEIQIIKYSYEVRENQQRLDDLLDQNRVLKYNVIVLKAPFNLENRLQANDIKLVLPERWQVVRVASSGIEREKQVYDESLPLVYNFFKFFTLGREAQAKPID